MKVFDLTINSMVFTGGEAIGRRSLYISATLFNRNVWLLWWDTARCTNPTTRRIYALSRDKVMCLTLGTR